MTTQQVYAENYFCSMSAVHFIPVLPIEGIHALSYFLHSPSIQISSRYTKSLSTLIMYAFLPMTTQQVYAENCFCNVSITVNPVIPIEGIHALPCFFHSPSIQIRLRDPTSLSTLIMYAYLPHDNPASLCRKLFFCNVSSTV
jgi:hypothetical protein